jgi:short-subunit dehydrogenase
VINNAGVKGFTTKLLTGSFDGARQAMEINYFGTWAVSRAFAPVLARNGGGALVNMLSTASWASRPDHPGYAASKAARCAVSAPVPRHGLQKPVHSTFAPAPGPRRTGARAQGDGCIRHH